MKESIIKLNATIAGCQRRIKKIQKKCPHENVKTETDANTGNWDPQDNCYWVWVECQDCDARMRFDSEKDKEMYRKYA
jgi:hypothetical protein